MCKCLSGGIGRHEGLKIPCPLKACRFEPGLGYTKSLSSERLFLCEPKSNPSLTQVKRHSFVSNKVYIEKFSPNPINTNILPATVLAPRTHPNIIELIDGRLHKFRVIGEDARFKVTAVLALHAHTRARKVG